MEYQLDMIVSCIWLLVAVIAIAKTAVAEAIYEKSQKVPHFF